MRNICRQFILTLLLLALCGCGGAPLIPAVSAVGVKLTSPGNSSTIEETDDRIKYADDLLSEKEVLTDGNYRIEKRRKPTVFEGKTYDKDGHQYAVLKYKGRVIARYDRLVNPLGTEIRFEVHPLFKPGGNQLIIEQTEYRGWQYWVVDLNQKAKIIYDSGQYGVGQDFGVEDIDGDGKEELVQNLLAFWFFDRLGNPDSPLIDIVFAYDARAKEYVPANYRFRDFVLKDIEQDIAQVKIARLKAITGYDGGLLSAILKVVLEDVYAGREKEAWEFYEAEYDLPDKAEMRAKIEKKLKEDSVYQTISKLNSRAGK